MVDPDDITEQLEGIASDDDFEYLAERLSEKWVNYGVGAEAVEPVLRFMEAHPEVYFGMPGALVQMIERSFGCGGTERENYEAAVVSSLTRKATTQTALLLNRIINATDQSAKRNFFLEKLMDSLNNPSTDEQTKQDIRDYLEFQAGKE